MNDVCESYFNVYHAPTCVNLLSCVICIVYTQRVKPDKVCVLNAELIFKKKKTICVCLRS